MFVAEPGLAPRDDDLVYAHPDDPAGSGASWRDVLCEYNRDYNSSPDSNPHHLLPAWQLYAPPTYKLLWNHYRHKLFILSAGWGLIRADFLTPNYDITFSSASNVQKFKRRTLRAPYRDFCLAPTDTAEPIVFCGGKKYVPLFCELTAAAKGQRTVYYAGSRPTAPGCTLISFGRPFTNWQYKCANRFVRGRSAAHESN